MSDRVDSSKFVSEYFEWVHKNPGLSEGAHTVGVKMAAIKIRQNEPQQYPWGHGSYSEGRLGLGGDVTGVVLKGRFKVLFSDRKSPQGGYRFDPKQSDIQDVTIFDDGKVRIELISWGHATLFLEDVKCYPDGFITGIMREINGVSMVSLILRKEIMLPEQDGFQDWL